MANITKYLGAPGTGKTTVLINEFKIAVDSGINPKDLLYNTYRREATRDAKKRIAEATGVAIRDLKFVKTMHGICLSLLYENGDVNPESVMQHADYKKFNTDCDYNIKPRKIIVDNMFAANDPYLSFYTTMKSSGVSLNDCCIIPSKLSPVELQEFVKEFEKWKSDNGKIDFSDMIEKVIDNDLIPDCSTQIYDEAQDMTTRLHTVAQMWSKEAEEVFLAGDPLQTLYPFWGSDPAYFLDWEGDLKVLPVSRRLPQNVWKIAGDLIEWCTPYRVPEIETKSEDAWIDIIDHDNLYSWLLSTPKNKNSIVFHLVRTKYTGLEVARTLYSLGIPFGGIWEYAWNKQSCYLYNAVLSVRSGSSISYSEFRALLDLYPEIDLISNTGCTKSEYLDMIHNGCAIPSLRALDEKFLQLLRADDPFESLPLTPLAKEKFMGALRRKVPKIEYKDIKVYLLTIHGAKGMEADTVFLHTAITPAIKTAMFTQKGRENEAYVWYVGITRAKRNLFFVTYMGKNYPIPGICS